MKALAIIINIFFPGIGTFFTGKFVQAIFQLLFYGLGLLLAITGLLALLGIPFILGAWIWGIITAATWQPKT